jgi:hypothetical protein
MRGGGRGRAGAAACSALFIGSCTGTGTAAGGCTSEHCAAAAEVASYAIGAVPPCIVEAPVFFLVLTTSVYPTACATPRLPDCSTITAVTALTTPCPLLKHDWIGQV